MSAPILRVLTLSFAFLAACNEQRSTSYATFADAERDGAITRGWIPGFVPRSATEIAETHDLDSNDVWIRLRAPPDALEAMTRKLDTDAVRWVAPPRDTPLWRSWPRDAAARRALRTFRTRDRDPLWHRCVAIDESTSTAYVWRCQER